MEPVNPLTEVVDPAYLGSALGLRSLVGYSAGAVSPLAFGVVLDWTNPIIALYSTWGWAFSMLGLGGIGAVWATRRFGKVRK